MGYEDENVNIFEQNVERRLERELERMLKFKNATDTLAKTTAAKETLDAKRILETYIQSGVNDPKLMPMAKNKLSEFNLTYPKETGYSQNLALEIATGERLENEKNIVRTSIETSLNNISKLPKEEQTSSEALDKLLGNYQTSVDRASELGLNSLVNSSNTRKRTLVQDINNKNSVISA